MQESSRWEKTRPETFRSKRKVVKYCSDGLEDMLDDKKAWKLLIEENTGRTDYLEIPEDRKPVSPAKRSPLRKAAEEPKGKSKVAFEEKKAESVASEASVTQSEDSEKTVSEQNPEESVESEAESSESEDFEPKYKRFKKALGTYGRAKLHWENANDDLKQAVLELPFSDYFYICLPG